MEILSDDGMRSPQPVVAGEVTSGLAKAYAGSPSMIPDFSRPNREHSLGAQGGVWKTAIGFFGYFVIRNIWNPTAYPDRHRFNAIISRHGTGVHTIYIFRNITRVSWARFRRAGGVPQGLTGTLRLHPR